MSSSASTRSSAKASRNAKDMMVDLLRRDQESKAFFRRLGKEERQQGQGKFRRTARRMRRALAGRLPRPNVTFLRKEANRAEDAAEQIWNELERSETKIPIVDGKWFIRDNLDRQTIDATRAAAEAKVHGMVQRHRRTQRKGRGKRGGGTRRRSARPRTRSQRRRRRSR